MAQEITIKQLFEDHLSLAWEQIAAYEYPYEVLADIGNIIKRLEPLCRQTALKSAKEISGWQKCDSCADRLPEWASYY